VDIAFDRIHIIGHGYTTGTPIYFYNPSITTGDALPGPLVENAALLVGNPPAPVNYYAKSLSADYLQVSSDPSGSPLINLTTIGAGTNVVSTSDHFDYWANQSYQYYGRLITEKTQTDSTITSTNRSCRSMCKKYVKAYFKARDTLVVGVPNSSLDGLGLPTPRKVQVTNAMEGLSSTPYAVTRENITADGTSGIFKRELNLGDAFEDNNDKGIIPGLGVGFVGDSVPPAPPTWPDQPILENAWYSTDNHVHVHLECNLNTEGDMFQYQWRITGGGFNGYLMQTLQPIVDLVLPPLPAVQSVTVEVRAADVSNNWSNPFASTWPSYTFTTVAPGFTFLYNAGFDEADPGDSTLPNYWTRSVANGGRMFRGGPSYAGAAALQLVTTSTAGTSAAGTSALTAADFLTCSLSFYAIADAPSPVFSWTFTWYAADGSTVLGTSTGSASPSGIGWVRFTGTATKPLNAASYTLTFANTSNPARTVWVDSVTVTRQMGPGDIEAGAVGTAQLALGSVDGTILAPVINYTGSMSLNAASEANALKGRVTDALNSAASRAAYIQHRLSSGVASVGMGSAIEFDADSTTTQDQPTANIATAWDDPTDATRVAHIRLQTNIAGSGSMSERLRITAQMVRTKTDTSLVVGDAARSTTATDGFIYLPTCVGKPTGVPTTQTGIIPRIWDSTNKIMWQYDGSWKALESEGTAMPASPYSGQRFYRSDLMLEVNYDGLRWLGPKLDIYNPFDMNHAGGVATPPTFTQPTTTLVSRFHPPSAEKYWVDSITYWVLVSTTNTGTQFWTLRLGSESNTFGGSVILDSDTKALTAGTAGFVTASTSFTGNPLDFSTTGAYDFFLEMRPTSTVGVLTLYGASMTLRKVYT
jgi:hypothetical protein